MKNNKNKTSGLTRQPNPLDELWVRLEEADLPETAERSRALVCKESLRIAVFGSEYLIEASRRRIVQEASGREAPFLLSLLLLQYVFSAKDIPAAGKRVNPLELPGGDFFFRGPHAFNLAPLEERFGRDCKEFLRAGQEYGGRGVELADAAFTLPALPRVPVTYGLWCADEEFPAKVTVFFDATAHRQLPLDMLWSLVAVGNKLLLSYRAP